LAERGYDVILLEKHPQTRTHIICTGIVGAEAFNRFSLSPESVLVRLGRARFISPGGYSLEYSTTQPMAFVVDRSRFDGHLQDRAARAGVRLCYGFQAERVDEGPEEIRIHGRNGPGPLQVRARLALLANGFNIRLTKSLGLPLPGKLIQGVQAEIPMSALETTEVHFGRKVAPDFFAWAVPVGPGCARIGLLAHREGRKHFEQLLAGPLFGGRLTVKPHAIQSRPIVQGALARTWGERFLVVGEAAGQVKTTTSGGIYYGLLCAELAAEALTEALRSPERRARALRAYHTRWTRLLGPELGAGMQLQRLASLLTDHQIDSLFRQLNSVGLRAAIEPRVRFDWHRDLIFFLLRHPSLARFFFHRGRSAPWWRSSPDSLAPSLRPG
jgi:flavin-dependent dehydrogenase